MGSRLCSCAKVQQHMTAAGRNAPLGVVSSAHDRFAEGQASMTTTALAENSFAYVLARCMTSVERPTPPLGDQTPYTVGYSVLGILPLQVQVYGRPGGGCSKRGSAGLQHSMNVQQRVGKLKHAAIVPPGLVWGRSCRNESNATACNSCTVHLHCTE